MVTTKLRTIHKAGTRVLKAISASIRIQILNLMLEYGSLSYSEIMNYMKLDATRDAGRFAYHLKSLLKADLIEPDAETKKYRLTDLGRRIVEITDEIEDRTYRRRKMFVRTSRLTIEEFDRNRIAQALVKEAGVSTDVAQKVARETERRLQQFKTKYLTAPLIREVVNIILLEKHYEDYRHKLTRVGLPIYEVTQLIATPGQNVDAIRKAASNAVMEEYTLLNVLPRTIADAHLDGSLNLHHLGAWVLKPNEVAHCFQCLFEAFRPKTLEAALNLTLNTIRNTATEATGPQNLGKFNKDLAPYLKGRAKSKIKELLQLFIRDLNKSNVPPVSISLEVSTEANDQDPDEARQLATLFIQTLIEENTIKPVQNPKIIVRLQRKMFEGKEEESFLYETHKLAASSLIVYFANLLPPTQKNCTYTHSGLRLADDWRHDWELDTQRTGNLDVVSVNLPRIAFDTKGDEDRFFELLDERLNLVNEALEIKYQTINKRIDQNLLPHLTTEINGENYFRLENSTRTITLVGLYETIGALMEQEIYQDYGRAFVTAERILKHINTYAKKRSKKPHTRLTTGLVPDRIASERFAELDIERHGWGIVKMQGTKEHPCYSDINRLPSLGQDQLALTERIHQLTPGGHLAIIESEQSPPPAQTLLSKTKEILVGNVEFFAFNLSLTICKHCQSRFHKPLLKCPNCGSTNTLTLARN